MRLQTSNESSYRSTNPASCFQASLARRPARGDSDVALPFEGESETVAPVSADVATTVSRELMDKADLTLDMLMRQALEVPGAASALLEAFAAQSRALRLVQEADARGAAQLPIELRNRLAAVAARTPTWLTADAHAGVRA